MNVIILSVDTFRKDKIGMYSNNNLTPNIDKLGKEGTILLQHTTTVNASNPSLISMFTGCYPTTTGSHENGVKFPELFKSMAQYLKEEGYITVGATGVDLLSSVYNFDKGFDTFFDNSKYCKLMHNLRKIGTKKYNLMKILREFGLFEGTYKTYEKINPKLINWLEKNHQKKFFLFVHYCDIHLYTKKILGKKYQKENYNKSVKLIDKGIGEIIQKLKELNIMNNSLIIVTADHGENFNEENKLGHGYGITEHEFNIPCILYKPGLIPKKKVY